MKKLLMTLTICLLVTSCGTVENPNAIGQTTTDTRRSTIEQKFHLELALNYKTGSWGATFGPAKTQKDKDAMRLVAFLSCISKDLNDPFTDVPSEKQIARFQAVYHSGNQCKSANLSYLGYEPRAAALFRTQLADGTYDFFGAFSKGDIIPSDEFAKQLKECKAKNPSTCKHIKTFSINNFSIDTLKHTERFTY